jgi:Protein of unknown function DUF262/Protein of unknown function (DUF1524)
MITLQPTYLSLSKLLDGRLFRIPEYQRAYSWTSLQRGDLFNDINKAHTKGPDEGHFMAGVVCLRRDQQTLGTDEYHVLDVVDGQQRLTTLIVLLNAIRLSLDSKNRTEAKAARELGELLVKVEGEELLLLQTNHDSSHHFANYLRNGVAEPSINAKTLADREILGAIEDCQQFVANWKLKHGPLSLLLALLKNRLFFILHEITEEKTVYTVFEVLNSRGLDVSWMDRLKSILMGAAFDLKKANHAGVIGDLHTIWRDVYAVVGLRQGLSTEALRFAATLRASDAPSRPLGEQDAVEVLRAEGRDAKSLRSVGAWLLKVTKACDAVLASPRLNAVTRISQARLLATAINLRSDLGEPDRDELMRKWEKVTFRIYGMLCKDARTRVGDYVRLAWRIVNESLPADEIGQAILGIGADFPIADAIDDLRESDYYNGWEDELRYVMFRHEEHLAVEAGLNFGNEQWEKIWMVSPSDSIEHIWASSKAPESIRDNIGNLVLLPPKLNSKLQDLSSKDKVSAYRKTGLLIASEVADIIDRDGWGKSVVLAREKALLKWAAKEWAD